MQKDGLPEDIEKDATDKIQVLTHDYSAKIDKVMATKEKDVMTV
jgi:ribosome recycling factor